MTKQIDIKLILEKMSNIKPLNTSRKSIEQASTIIPKNLMFDAQSTEFIPETKAQSIISKGLTIEEAKSFDDEMTRFIDTVLIKGIDFGVISNFNKPTLLKSGAEKILNYLQLIARVEIINRVEDFEVGFFSYESKVYLIDHNGVIRAEGVATCNSKESNYASSNGFCSQNTVLKMAKKRALVDATLNVGNLSSRFTQDVEDMNISTNNNTSDNAPKPMSQSQLNYLESLMSKHGTSSKGMSKYTKKEWGVDDYKNVSSNQASLLIEKFKSLEKNNY